MAARDILIVKLSSMGDLFHALPAVHALRVGLNAEVDWVTQPEYARLVRCFTDVRDVIPFPRHRVLRGLPEYLRVVRRRRYDLVVDLQGLMKSLLAAKCANAAKIVGPSYCREGSRYFYDAVCGSPVRGRHAVDAAMDVVRYLGIHDQSILFPVSFPDANPIGSRPRVAILPASRHENKNWPLSSYADLSRRLIQDGGALVYLFGGDADRELCSRLQHAIEAGNAGGKVVNMTARTGMPELGGWLKAMDLVVANDSGPIHMAAAGGTKVLALFGPTDPARTGPYGAGHRVLTGESACRPCFQRQCRGRGVECLRLLPVEAVYAAARDLLNRRDA